MVMDGGDVALLAEDMPAPAPAPVEPQQAFFGLANIGELTRRLTQNAMVLFALAGVLVLMSALAYKNVR
jgi:hypothetical protein